MIQIALRLLVLLLLTILATGCASSGFVGSPAPPPGYFADTVAVSEPLDAVNDALSEGRFALVTTSGRTVDVRSVRIGPTTTQFRKPRETPRYLPTDEVERVEAGVGGSGAATGAFIGMTPGLALMIGALIIASDDNEGCDSNSNGCAFEAILFVSGVAAGGALMATGALVGAGIGALSDPSRSVVLYEGPVTRYLPEPTPSVQSDL